MRALGILLLDPLSIAQDKRCSIRTMPHVDLTRYCRSKQLRLLFARIDVRSRFGHYVSSYLNKHWNDPALAITTGFHVSIVGG